MSTTGGAIAVSVQVPVVGTVVGRRTLQEISSGTPPKPPVEGPAVVVKDADPRTLAMLSAAPAAGAAEPTVAEVVVSETPAAATPAPAAAEAADPEAEANQLLQLAENYLRANMKSMAVRKLEDLLKQYPKTEAAQKAKEKLAELK